MAITKKEDIMKNGDVFILETPISEMRTIGFSKDFRNIERYVKTRSYDITKIMEEFVSESTTYYRELGEI